MLELLSVNVGHCCPRQVLGQVYEAILTALETLIQDSYQAEKWAFLDLKAGQIRGPGAAELAGWARLWDSGISFTEFREQFLIIDPVRQYIAQTLQIAQERAYPVTVFEMSQTQVGTIASFSQMTLTSHRYSRLANAAEADITARRSIDLSARRERLTQPNLAKSQPDQRINRLTQSAQTPPKALPNLRQLDRSEVP